jgi:hypothetical protein
MFKEAIAFEPLLALSREVERPAPSAQTARR